jgi:hypothetical protein
MIEGQTITRKEFPNGDVAVDEGNGPVYHTPDARYTVEMVPPPPLSEDPYGVDLVRTTRSEHGLPRRQRLTLAEYHSYMSAEEHVREVEGTLLEQGREGLQTEMALVEAMPYEPDSATYLTGIYPPEWSSGRVTLSVIRLEGERVDVAPVAYGPVDRLAAVDRRLEQALAEGGPARLLDVATAEAVQAGILPPGTPLFAPAGEEWGVNRLLTVENRPAGPALAVPGLPVTFEDDMTPLDAQGRYVAHHRDAAGTVHFFAVMDRPPEDLTPGDAPRELRYFRAQKTAEGQVIHDSLPVMPVSAPGSPWPIPIFSSLLEDDRLEEVQSLARDLAHLNDLPFPDTLPPLGAADPEPEPESGWYHYDTALVLATPQGVDDGFSVGAVDVYRNHQSEGWAARYLPMGEFDTLDDALGGERLIMQMRAEERKTASPAQFRDEPAIYERIARAEADAALTDLLEQHDGHLPPDYDGDHEPQWEPLTSKEWEAYRDFVQMIRDADPDIAPAYGTLPTATPRFADETLVAGSEQPAVPYRTPEDFRQPLIAPTWRLDIVPARDPEGAQLGYSAVCVVDFGDLAGAMSPETPEHAQWLEVAQFQTEERATKFRDDFMSLVGADKRSNAAGPALAEGIAGDLGLGGKWQVMDGEALEKLKAGEWAVEHPAEAWQPRLNEASNPALEAAYLDIDL